MTRERFDAINKLVERFDKEDDKRVVGISVKAISETKQGKVRLTCRIGEYVVSVYISFNRDRVNVMYLSLHKVMIHGKCPSVLRRLVAYSVNYQLQYVNTAIMRETKW